VKGFFIWKVWKGKKLGSTRDFGVVFVHLHSVLCAA
jgi:hypothetical protein